MSDIILNNTITCPECGASADETMPEDACQYFWKCPECEAVIKPKPGDCCVYCSYGEVKCPPKQTSGDDSCC